MKKPWTKIPPFFRRWTVTAIILVGLYYATTTIAAYLSAPRIDMTMSPIAGRVAVTVALAERRSIVATTTYTGTIVPYLEATVFPRTEGWLKEVLVDVGDPVNKDQIIVTLDRHELLDRLAERRADRIFLEQEYYRNKMLVEEKAISQSEFDRSKAQFEMTRAQEAHVETLLGYTGIKAPLGGVVTERLLLNRPGQLVNPQTPILKLGDMSRMRVQISVAARDAPFMRAHRRKDPSGHPGTEARIRIPALDNRVITGRVSSIFPTLDPVTRTNTVEVVVDNADRSLMAGMYVIVDLVLERKANAIVIPKRAVLTVDNTPTVFVTDGVVAIAKEVTSGIAEGNRIEIVHGVEEGELIITKGNRGLVDFQEIQIVEGF